MAYLKVVNENGTKRLIDYSKAPQYNKLAVNEPTTTASQSYTKGEYLTQGGYFKKVTSAISSGDTISSSNTEDTTVGEELTQINSSLSELSNKVIVGTVPVTYSNGVGTVNHNLGISGNYIGYVLPIAGLIPYSVSSFNSNSFSSYMILLNGTSLATYSGTITVYYFIIKY